MKVIKIILLVAFLAIFSTAYGDFESTMARSAFEFATNPSQFLFEIENDSASYHIHDVNQKFNIQTNLILTGFTVLNVNTSFLLYSDPAKKFKTIFSIGYWNILGLSMIDSDSAGFKATADGFVPTFIFSKGINEEVEFFTGLKYSSSKLSIKLDEPLSEEGDDVSSLGFDLTEVTEIEDKIGEVSVFWGVYSMLPKNKDLNLCVGYQFNTQRIFTKIQLDTKFFTYGLGLYPDSVLFFHPQISFQYNF